MKDEFSFTIHKLNGCIQNIYIVEYVDKILVLDGACRADELLIENFIANKLQRPVSDIKLMVVSHMHPDHAGAVLYFRDKYKISIASYFIADDWYKGICGAIQHIVDIILARFVVVKSENSRKKLWYKRFIQADYKLKHKDKLPFFPDWQILHVPGHTSHDISLYNPEKKILYIGDNIVEINGKYMLPFPVVFPELMKKSLVKLAELEINNLLFAHGEMSKKSNYNRTLKRLSRKTFEKPKGYFKLLKLFTKFSVCASKS